jgi:hypothetical protein
LISNLCFADIFSAMIAQYSLNSQLGSDAGSWDGVNMTHSGMSALTWNDMSRNQRIQGSSFHAKLQWPVT